MPLPSTVCRTKLCPDFWRINTIAYYAQLLLEVLLLDVLLCTVLVFSGLAVASWTHSRSCLVLSLVDFFLIIEGMGMH